MAKNNTIQVAGYINKKLKERGSSPGFYIISIAEVALLELIYVGVRRSEFMRGMLVGAASLGPSSAMSFHSLWPLLISGIFLSLSWILYILNKGELKQVDELFDNIKKEMEYDN